MGYEYIPSMDLEEKIGKDEKELNNEQLTIQVHKLRKKVNTLDSDVGDLNGIFKISILIIFIITIAAVGYYYGNKDAILACITK